MSRPLLLGIDDGTTAVKAALFDLDLRPVAQSVRRVPTVHPRPGRVEQDPLAIEAAVVDAVAELLDGEHGEVVAAGLDHQGESVLAWDADGTPLTPVHVWQDKRADEMLARLRGTPAGEEVVRRSGLPLDPYFSAPKLAWLLAHDPAVAAARSAGTLRLGTVDAFLSDRLGAGAGTDPSTASRTQLQALGAVGWDAELAAAFGVPVALLPAVAPTAGDLGTLRHARWRQELPLTARVCDQQAALAGAGCVRPGLVKATYGTGVFVLAHVGDAPADGDGDLLPTVAWQLPDGRVEHALDGGVFTAGALLEWLSGPLGLAADPPALAALAETVADAGGVRVLPALAGLGAPWWAPGARAVVAGLTGGSTPAHVARAALEAIAWRVADIVELVPPGTTPGALRVDGGLSRSPLLLQLQADAIGMPVVRATGDATVRGAALLAAVGAGRYPSLAAGAERLATGTEILPQRDAAWRAAEHARWRTFVERARALDAPPG